MDSDLLIALGIVISTSIASLLPSLKDLTDKRYKWYRRLKAKGWITILFLLTSIGLTFFQLYRNKDEAKAKEIASNKIIKNKEKEERKRFDSTINTILKTGADALGKYGFILDSANKKLIKSVHDSSNIKYITNENPVLVLCPGDGLLLKEIVGRKYYFRVKLCSVGAGSTNFKLKCQSAIRDTLGTIFYAGNINLIKDDYQILPNGAVIVMYNIESQYDDNGGIADYYLYLKGTYSNLDNSKIYIINRLYSYNFNKRVFQGLHGKEADEIINVIKSNK